MASQRDERIVSLSLDSKDFNRDVDTSVDSLNKLKKSLEFENASKGFDQLEKEIRFVDMSPLEKGVERVSQQFNLLTTIADTTFRRITNGAIDAGINLVKSLSVDQVGSGWSQYEERMTAVQRITSATANQFESTEKQTKAITDSLSKLTWFTDETSFHFLDMANNMGKFTSNNVKLNVAANAMQGISTWAAISGANMEESGRAMYNLAQAIAVGSVKLIDWKSIQNANMATTEFKNTAIETALAFGTLSEVAPGVYQALGSKDTYNALELFSDGLKDAWFTSDVLLGTLDKYGGYANKIYDFVEATGVATTSALNMVDEYIDGTLDMNAAAEECGITVSELNEYMSELGSSEYDLGRRALRAAQETKTLSEAVDYVKTAVSSGWATTFENIFGAYEESKAWWSELSEELYTIFVESGDARNEMLELWAAAGGRNDLINAFRELLGFITDIKGIFQDAWGAVFPNDLETRANWLLGLTDRFREFASGLRLTEESAESLQNLLEGIFRIVDILKIGLKAFGKVVSPIAGALNKLAGEALKAVAALINDFAGRLEDFIKGPTFNKFINFLTQITTLLSKLSGTILVKLVQILGAAADRVMIFYNQWQAAGGGISALLETIGYHLSEFWNRFTEGETIVNRALNIVIGLIGSAAAGIITVVDNLIKVLKGELSITQIFEGDSGWTESIKNFIGNVEISELIDSVSEKFQSFTKAIRGFVDDLTDADSALREGFRMVGDQFMYLYNFIKGIMNEIDIDDVKDLMLITILAMWVKSLTNINVQTKKLLGSVTTTVTSFNTIIQTISGQGLMIDKVNKLLTASKVMQFGLTIVLVVNALAYLNTLDFEQTVRSVTLLGVTFSALLVVYKKFNKLMEASQKNKVPKTKSNDKKGFSLGIGVQLLAVAGAVSVIATTMKQLVETFQNLYNSTEGDIAQIAAYIGGAVISIAAIIASLGVFIKLMDKVNLKKTSKAAMILIGLGVSMDLIAMALKSLAKIDSDWGVLKAAGAISGIILAIGVMMKLMSGEHLSAGKVAALSTTLIALAGAMGVFTTAVAALTGLESVMDGTLQKAIDSFIVMLVGLTASLGVLIGLTGAINISSNKLKSLSLSMVTLSAAMVGLSGSVAILSILDYNKVVEGLKSVGIVAAGLAAALAALGALTLIPGVTPAVIDQLAGSLLKLSASFAVIAGSIGVLSLAMNSFIAVMAGMGWLATTLDQAGISIEEFVHRGSEVVKAAITELLDFLPSLAPKLLAIFAAIWAAIQVFSAMKREEVIKEVVLWGLAIVYAISQYGEPILAALEDLLNFVRDHEDQLHDVIYDLGYYIGKTIADGIHGALDGIMYSILDPIGEAIGPEWQDAVGMMFGTDQKKLEAKANSIFGYGNDTFGMMAYSGSNPFQNRQKDVVLRRLEEVLLAYEQGNAVISEEQYRAGVEAADKYDEGWRDRAQSHSPPQMIFDQTDDINEAYQIGFGKIGETNRQGGIIAATNFVEGFKLIRDGMFGSGAKGGGFGLNEAFQKEMNAVSETAKTGAENASEEIRTVVLNKTADAARNIKLEVEGTVSYISTETASTLMELARSEEGLVTKNKTNLNNIKINFGGTYRYISAETAKQLGLIAQYAYETTKNASDDVKETVVTTAEETGEKTVAISAASGVSAGAAADEGVAAGMEAAAEGIYTAAGAIGSNAGTKMGSNLTSSFTQWLQNNLNVDVGDLGVGTGGGLGGLFSGFGSKSTMNSYIDELESVAKSRSRPLLSVLYTLDPSKLPEGVDAKSLLTRLVVKGKLTDSNREKVLEKWGLGEDDWTKTYNDMINEVYGGTDQSIADAINKSSSGGKAVGAAKSNVDQIANAYKDAISQIDLDDELNELQYKLWVAENPNASQAEKEAMQLARTNDEIANQLKRVEAAQQQYVDKSTELGENSREAQEALKTYLEAQIKLVELQNEATNKTSQSMEDRGQAFREATDAFYKTMREAQANGRDLSAYAPAILQQYLKQKELNDLAEQAGKAIPEYYAKGIAQSSTAPADALNKTMSQSEEQSRQRMEQFKRESEEQAALIARLTTDRLSSTIAENSQNIYNTGKNIDTGLSNGIADNSDIPSTTSAEMSQDVIDQSKETFGEHSPSTVFYEIGQNIIAGLVNAIEDGRSTVVNSVIQMVTAAIQAAYSAAGVASPSKKTYYIGKMLDYGLVNGVDDYKGDVKNSMMSMLKGLESEAQRASKDTSGYLRDVFNLSESEATVSMVVDLNDKKVYDDLNQLETVIEDIPSKIDEYVKEGLEGEGHTIHLGVDTTELDAAIAKYREERVGVNAEIGKDKAFWRDFWDEYNLYADGLDPNRGYGDTVARRLLGGVSLNEAEAIRRNAYPQTTELESIYAQVKEIQSRMNMEQVIRDLADLYDTRNITVNYTQNNTSPQPLSAVDIYRDTRKQLDAFKTAIDKRTLGQLRR